MPGVRSENRGSALRTLVTTALHRIAHDRLIVGATAVLVLAGLVQLAAAPIYTDAVSVGALRWSIASADPEDSTLLVEIATAPATVQAVDEVVLDRVTDLTRHGDADARTVSRRLVSTSFGLPDTMISPRATDDPDNPDGADAPVDLTVLAAVSDLARHTTLVDGTWPEDQDRAALDPIEAVLEADVADRLDLEPGSVVELTGRRDGALVVVEIVGLYTRDDPADRFWTGDELLATGVVDGRSFRTLGPFVVSERTLIDAWPTRLEAEWLVDPDLSDLTRDDTAEVATQFDRLPDRLAADLERLPPEIAPQVGGLRVSTGLPELLRQSSRSITVTRSGVSAVTAQLAVLAGLALAVGASLLVEARRGEIAVLRSRGASRGHLVGLSIIEAAVLVGPATLAAPWLAAQVLRALDRWGPLSTVGFPVEPTVDRAAWLPVGIAGIAMTLLLAMPVLRASGASGRPSRHGRQARRSAVQRAGFDVALGVATVAAFWQLGRLGSGARSVLGDRFAIDPLLVVVPALALLTGAVAALRFVPLLARLAERLVTRGRSVVGTLVGWQVARRPSDQARAVFLLALALAIGGYAAAYAATWRTSQSEQATQRVGADLRVLPDLRSGQAIDSLHLVTAHRDLGDVRATLAVSRSTSGLPATEDRVTAMALDAAVAADVVLLDGDRRREFADAMALLAEQRPALAGLPLPGEPVRLEIEAVAVEDPLELPEGEPEPPAGFDGWVDVVLQDADGMLHRLEVGRLTAGTGVTHLGVDLVADGPGGQRVPAHPLRIVGIEMRLPVPEPPSRDVLVELGPVTAHGADGSATAVPWRSSSTEGDELRWSPSTEFTTGLGQPPDILLGPIGSPEALIADSMRLDVATGSFAFAAALVVYEVVPLGGETLPALPIVVDRAWLAGSGTEVGDRIELPGLGLDGILAEVVGAVDGVPTVDPASELVVLADLPTLQAMTLRPGQPIGAVDELWLATADGSNAGDDGRGDRLRAILEGPGFESANVSNRVALQEELRADPVALAAIGAYVVGAGAASVFAVVVFATTAALSARQRRHEFALLRALGLSSRQFRVWMALEQVVLLVVAVVLGTLLGLGLAFAVLPRLSLDQAGAPVVPSPRAVIPWETLAAVELVPAAALVVIVVIGAIGFQRRVVAAELRGGDD